ncbi:phosphodiester glycosidase family protein [Myceligenerans sp. TRM 65318]|uniref:Phosphodiester glycosidase family protein n=1 Tax=Myceligenerans pegani TaxID=2776917 RepID=A0ABR9N5K7_9MICO|nr:phosphodiester glycosidase family protein [Myceligenerans sp. TRM 65318]MBE3021223.1 phosphodiester glycosidase family protein [Myceligenerans sp. TRM 65318]
MPTSLAAAPASASTDAAGPPAPVAPPWAPPAVAPSAPARHSDASHRTDRVADLPLDDDGAALVTQRDEVLVAPGLELTRFTRLSADGWLSGEILVARLGEGVEAGYVGPERAPGLPVVAGNATVTEMAAARDAVAAVNGDYFDINNSGAALGAAVDGGTLLKSANPGRERAAAFGPDGAGRLAELFLDGSLTWTTAGGGGGSMPLAGVNVTALPSGGVAVYDATWGSFSRARAIGAGETGVEVRLDPSGVVTAVGRPGEGQLGDGERAVVARPGGSAGALAALAPGDRVDVAYALRDAAGDGPGGAAGEVEVAVGGGAEDWLLEDGEVTSATGSHVELRHPRTAVGFGPDGRTAYFVVVDGRQAGSIGMDLYELGELFAQLGAEDAINLDGGGSSQMVARIPGDVGTSILNDPSDGYERRDANGLGLFVPAGSGRVTAYDVRTTVPADDAGRVFPGLHRTLVAKGYDEVMYPVGVAPTSWRDDSRAVRVSGRRDGTAVVTGSRPGTARVTARHLSGRGAAAGSTRVEVLGPLVRTAVGTPLITLADDAATAPLVLTGYDADGFAAPIEARDVTVTGGRGDDGEPVAELVPAGDGSFTVTALRGSGATSFTLAVTTRHGTVTSRVAVAVGLEDVTVADLADAASWTSAHARAPGGVVEPAAGHDGAAGLRIAYDFTGSTATRGQYAVAPGGGPEIPGQPRAVTMWVHGDGNGAWLRLQVRQGDGVVTNLDGPLVDWTGWRLAEFAVPDGVEFPLTMQRLRVLETRAAAQYTGEIVVSDVRAQVPPDVDVPAAARVEDPVVADAGDTDDAPLRVAVMSDAQFVARDPDSPAVDGARQALREIVAADPDLLVINGDLVDEAAPEDFDLARRILTEELGAPGTEPFPWYYLPGNHEIMGGAADNFRAEFGDTTRVVDVPARGDAARRGDGGPRGDGGVTRMIHLDSSTGRLGSDFAQLRMLRDALDDAATDSRVTGVLVFAHHPLDDPLPTKASQLSDRLEADTLRTWFEDFEARSGKPVASVNAHAGVFHADTRDGVPYLINGNSGKSPASTPADGGFTGWSLLGIDPRAGTRAGDEWLDWEVSTRADEVRIAGPEFLERGRTADVAAVVVQDGGREVPVDWPVSASWGGERVCVADLDRHGHRHARAGRTCDRRDVVAVDPDAGTVLALRRGVAELEVTVNETTGALRIRTR